MAMPTNTQDTYNSIGIREDLSDIIYNISPTETPFMSTVGRGNASQTLHEWQMDVLATAAVNSVIEGDDAVADAAVATVRLGNICQISDKVVSVSGTHEAVDKAGRKSELAYQLAKRAKELKRDLEFIVTGNYASHAGVSDTTARTLGSLEAWYETNTLAGLGGSDGGHSSPGVISARTDGTLRALAEADLKTIIAGCWTEGGDPTMIMVGPFNKAVVSGFDGGGTKFDRMEDKRLVAAIDVYVSDFGEHRIVPNRFSRDESCHVLTPRLWSIDYLRSFRQHPLAKTGDSERRQLLCEYTLRSSNEAGSGLIADCSVS